ncbi:3-hydroxyisobutyrate dehydrogenase [Litorivivens lipolytica]|uniref:3-hydroxyisobutyrate dehydrogenase n=1 Tax=Litorivivens lipolytica TaxID=1524264 RepID=A0A7W4Z5M2_9GAMM|nr:NAD(P)-dependent oxidoreductase [Litorivivens lipolytica]MBB3046126.1 3-hydroxyisobutyrate dehydrogenase [Litorivivens lipolytica]
MIQVGYIGLGNIGKPMCSTLIKNGASRDIAVTVYDVMPDPVAEMVELGATKANSVREIVERCDLVGVCVRDDNDVDSILYGDQGMLEHARPGTIIAIHSTVTKTNMLRWASDGAGKDIHIIDAPITGGASGAAEGTLCIMVGASEAVLERALPMLEATSKRVVRGGDVGSGIVLKLANNVITYAAFTAVSEAVALVKKSGLNPEDLYAVGEINGVITPSGKQFITGREGLLAGCTEEQMLEFFGPFAGLGEKDLDHALGLCKDLQLDLPATKTVREHIRQTFLKGQG